MTRATSDNPATPSAPAAAPGVSKLAAKVAHELNNPLDAVLRFVSLAQRKAQSGNYDDLQRHLADAQFGLQRMAEILRELMHIGRQTHDILARPQPLPLADLIAASVRTIAAQAEQKQVRVDVDDRLAGAPAAFDLRLSQIVANLLKNAVEAAPEGSVVELVIEFHPAVEKQLRVVITDSGPGVAPDLLPQLFSPFITTKPTGAGHGLGLAISRELALSLGGTLTLNNRPAPERGCVATVILPLA
jgi:two-component system C4-dicarboxylate transport sensor histidine kinase DctB